VRPPDLSERPAGTELRPPAHGCGPRHVGEHIRKVRMDRGLLQKEVAQLVGVDRDTVRNWEVGRSEPALRHWPGVHRILGFIPFEIGESLSERLRAYRTIRGISQATLAEELSVDESTIHGWETGAHSPSPALRPRLDEVFEDLERALAASTPREAPASSQGLESPTNPARFTAGPSSA